MVPDYFSHIFRCCRTDPFLSAMSIRNPVHLLQIILPSRLLLLVIVTIYHLSQYAKFLHCQHCPFYFLIESYQPLKQTYILLIIFLFKTGITTKLVQILFLQSIFLKMVILRLHNPFTSNICRNKYYRIDSVQ